MNLLQTITAIETEARRQPAVKGVTPNNVYDLNNNPAAKYGNFAWVEGQHREDLSTGIRTFNFSLFYVDRLLKDKSNKNEIQSTGVDVLGNIVRRLVADGEIWIEDDITYQPFNERFADECSGVYCSVALKTYTDGNCEEVYPPYSSMRKVARHLYDVTYNHTVTEEEAEEYLATKYSGGFGRCTSMADESFGVHFLDWYLTNLAEFHVSTPGDGRRYSSHSMGGNIPGLTDEAVDARPEDEALKWLPFTVVDGCNSEGVFATVNVVSSLDGRRTIGTNPGKPRMNQMRIVRYILDHHNSAEEAVYDIADNFDVYAPQGAVDEEFHWIIGDAAHRYILEFTGNEPVILDVSNELAYMTNFRLGGVRFNADGTVKPESVEAHGQGVERYDIVATHREDPLTVENVMAMAADLKFTRAYTDSIPNEGNLPARKTEFTGVNRLGDFTVTTPVEAFWELWRIARERFNDPDRRRNGDVWQTEHLAIYDLTDGALTLYIQEDFVKAYRFEL